VRIYSCAVNLQICFTNWTAWTAAYPFRRNCWSKSEVDSERLYGVLPKQIEKMFSFQKFIMLFLK